MLWSRSRYTNVTSFVYVVTFNFSNIWSSRNILGVRARFCRTFAAILKQIEKKTHTIDYADALCRLNIEYQNFRKLFTDVIYCTEDTYHVFIDLAATTIAGGSILFTTMATYSMRPVDFTHWMRKWLSFLQKKNSQNIFLLVDLCRYMYQLRMKNCFFVQHAIKIK